MVTSKQKLSREAIKSSINEAAFEDVKAESAHTAVDLAAYVTIV